MKISLVLIAPEIIAPVFTEVINLYAAHLTELGHVVLISHNKFKKEYLNILFGYQQLPPEAFSTISENYRYIICQLELLSIKGGWLESDGREFNDMRPLFDGALQIWDFAKENIDYLSHQGISAHQIQPGYHRALSQCLPVEQQDIDVLFYGSLSKRRLDILEKLGKECRVETLHNVYGNERGASISRSKIVLNLHWHANIKHTEQVRISYLFNNHAFVISEHCEWHPYGHGLIHYPYDEIVHGVLDWLKRSDTEREQHRAISEQCLKETPMRESLIAALDQIEV